MRRIEKTKIRRKNRYNERKVTKTRRLNPRREDRKKACLEEYGMNNSAFVYLKLQKIEKIRDGKIKGRKVGEYEKINEITRREDYERTI